MAVTRILLAAGIGDIAVGDTKGIIHAGRTDLTPVKADIAAISNRANLTGSIVEALAGADVFIGLSSGTVPESAVATMAPNSIIFAMANPNPEVHPEVAHKYAAIVATGRSDFPNQINNVLAFPGVFRGAFDVRASRVTENMKLAAARALADVIADELTPDHIIPSPFDARVAPAVAAAVASAAKADGVARR
jgi:malate dehydrogenase (oxaloacetate-decarboxylating)